MSDDTRWSSDGPLVVAAWSIVALVAAALPLRNWDYWFDLTVGRLLALYHAIPAQNVFGFSSPPSTPIFVHTWIGDFWLYTLHQQGGLVAALAARNLCALTALALLAWCTYRLTERNAVATAIGVLASGLAFLAVSGFAGPQIFSWPLFGILAALSVASLTSRRLIWVVPLAFALGTGFWANASPNFWVPPLLAGSFALVARHRGETRRAWWFVAAVVTSIAAMFVTPLGVRVFEALFNGTGAESWLILAAPLVLAPIADRIPRWTRPVGRWVVVVAVALLAAAALSVQPWSDAHRAIPAMVFGDDVRQTDPLRGYGPASVPVEAVEVLRSWGSQPRVYAEPHLSGYLLYELQDPTSPAPIVWPVPDRPPTDEIAALSRAIETQPEVFRGAFRQFGVQAVLVTPGLGQLGAFIASAPDWQKVGEWPSGALYIPERPTAPASEPAPE